MDRLTLAKVCDLASGQDIREVKVINASRKDIKHVDDISPCVELEKLNISHNLISSVDGFKYCCSLTWLDVSHNQLESLSGIQSLVNLSVLNAGHNMISTLGNISALKALKALILNNNDISSITGLSCLKQLNALVLSHNQLEMISLDDLSLLTKLSLSHNLLTTCPDTRDCHKLKELRLNNNKIFGELPNTLRNNQCLEILDIGHNLFPTWDSCSVLHQLTSLHNLNLNGNKFSTGQFYRQVLDDLPSLDILNGKKRSSYDVSEQVVMTADHTATDGQSHTNTTDTGRVIKSAKRVKLRKQSDDVPTKRVKQKDRGEDNESDRYSIAAISGEPMHATSKAKQKTKSLSGVISVTKPKRRTSKKATDISRLNYNVTFGTGQTSQWF